MTSANQVGMAAVGFGAMERAAWTDERLDDLADAMRSGFARVDGDIRDLRAETREGFASVRTEVAALEAGLRAAINELRRVMLGVGGGIILALIGVIAAILARGA